MQQVIQTLVTFEISIYVIMFYKNNIIPWGREFFNIA